jgi:hypothetical protein
MISLAGLYRLSTVLRHADVLKGTLEDLAVPQTG